MSQILKLRFPVTLELVIYAFIMSVFFSVPVAVLSARKPHGIIDRISIATEHVRALDSRASCSDCS